ncbi:hypothetical protein GCM10011446_09920 [Acinetobacter vivianii]|nr:hypothetical protein GCM10011446_09920 [Acinetobacter vivianii]
MLSDNHTITEIKNNRGLGKKDLNIVFNNPCCAAINFNASSYDSKLKTI